MDEFIKVTAVKNKRVPMLICSDNNNNVKNPIILLHRILEDKESELTIAYYLARQGHFVVIPDLLHHGESEASFRTEQKMDFNLIFTELDQTMERIHQVIIFLQEQYSSCIDMEQLGVIGSSYGGMLALTATYYFTQIHYVATFCSSANWHVFIKNHKFETFRLFSKSRPVMDSDLVNRYIDRYDPIYHVDKYGEKRVLMMNGVLDTTFTEAMLQPFVEKMNLHYKNIGRTDLFTWKQYSNAGHKVTYVMINDLLEWLAQ